MDEGTMPDYSRDALLGWMLYLLKTHDVSAMNRGSKTIRLYMPSLMRSSTIHIYNLVAEEIGASKYPASGFDPMDIGTLLATKTTANSARHLQAIKLMMLYDMGWDSWGMKQAVINLAREEPSNPFFAYVAGNRATPLVFEAWDTGHEETEEGYLWRRDKEHWEGEGTSYVDFAVMCNLLLGGG